MQVADLANVFPTETMEAGTVLFEQGGTDGDGFIVQVGKVELSREVGGSVPVSYTHLTLPTIVDV